jgi:hypothetical protein
MEKSKERQFLLPLAELVDRLTIDQIKEVLLPEHCESFAREMEKIEHDIDTIVGEKDVHLTARLLRMVIVIAQMNLHIWQNKDLMERNPDDTEAYLRLLKLSHQLNGVKNRIKNLLLEETGDREKSLKKSNFNTDGLRGWEISLS